MDPVEKKYRATKYRIEMYDYDPGMYPDYEWVGFRVYRPRTWWGRGWIHFASSHVCHSTKKQAYQKAQDQATEVIKRDIKRRYKSKPGVKTGKTVYVSID
jgi:hypothetical protein